MTKPTVTYKLQGALKGQSITLNGFTFVDGVYVTSAYTEEEHVKLAKVFEPWQGVRVDGERDIPENEGDEDIHSDLQPEGGQPQAGESSNSNGDGAVESDQVEQELDVVSDGVGPEKSVAEPEDPTRQRIRAAVLGLDPAHDPDWTQGGKPALAAVERLLGFTGITRALVESVMPGYTRPKK